MRIGYFTRISMTGNSFTVTVPKDVRMALNIGRGDFVYIEIKKMVIEDESNLHDNNAARPSPQTRDNGIHQEE